MERQQKMKKKMLMMASTFPRWKNDSTAAFILELAKKLSGSFDVHVLAPHFSGAKKYEEFEGIKIHRFQYFWPESLEKLCYGGGILPNIKNNKFLIIQAFILTICELIVGIKIIIKENIKIIHAFWLFPQGFVAMLLKMFLRTEYIVTSLGGDMFPFKTGNKLFLWWYKKIVNNAVYVTAVNSTFVQELQGLRENKIFYIPNGVNIEKLKPMKNIKKTRNILFVGRLAEKKGLQYLIEALSGVSEKLYDKLLVVGEGPLQSSLKEKVKELHLTKKISFLDSKPYEDLILLYNKCLLIVVPSITTAEGDREGFPTVYLDSMACGCPIITTDIEGIKSIIQNNKNGIIVKQKNSEALSKAIISLLNDEKLRMAISKKALEDVRKKYSWDVVSKEYIKLISQI